MNCSDVRSSPRFFLLMLVAVALASPAGGQDSTSKSRPATKEAEALYKEGERLQAIKDFVSAVEKWEELLKRFADGDLAPLATFHAGFCHLSLHDFDRAERSFAKLIKAVPNSPIVADAWFYRGHCRRGRQKYKEATVAYEQAAKLTSGLLRAAAMNMVGEMYRRRGEYRDAFQKYRRVVHEFDGQDESIQWAQKHAAFAAGKCVMAVLSPPKPSSVPTAMAPPPMFTGPIGRRPRPEHDPNAEKKDSPLAEPKSRVEWINAGKQLFEFVIAKQPKDELAKQASEELRRLDKLK